EPASPTGDDSQGEACPTVSGLEAKHDRANITKTSTLPHESTSRVTSFVADEGTQELEINRLKAKIKLLEDKYEGVAEQSRDDAPIKGRRLDEREEAAKRKKKLQEQIDVQVVRELEDEMARDAQRMNEQVARDAEIARIHAKEELQMMIDGLDENNETVAKYLQEYHQFATELPIGRRIKLIRLTLEEIKEKFDPVWKQIQDFIPIGSKEEAERFKRKGLRLELESVKKLKTSKEVKATQEILEEKVKEMMQLVHVEEVYVEALQVKHPIIDSKVHTEGQRSYWKIIRLGDSSASYQFFVDMLKHFDREDLNQL
nr:hypothetical protein [Tanacetum cinerariifolium]